MPEISKNQSIKWLLRAFVGLCAVGMLTLFLVLVFGQVRGTEIATDSFDMRDFRYFRLPWVNQQLTAAKIKPISNRLIKHLATNKLLPTTPRRWDVVESFTSGRLQQGDASILRNYLTMANSGNTPIWLKWSQERPEQASEFWPVVQQATDLGVYELLPTLFQLAENTPSEMSAAEFKQQTEAHLAKAYGILADVVTAVGEPERAQQLKNAAEELDPDGNLRELSFEPIPSQAESP